MQATEAQMHKEVCTPGQLVCGLYGLMPGSLPPVVAICRVHPKVMKYACCNLWRHSTCRLLPLVPLLCTRCVPMLPRPHGQSPLKINAMAPNREETMPLHTCGYRDVTVHFVAKAVFHLRATRLLLATVSHCRTGFLCTNGGGQGALCVAPPAQALRTTKI